MPLQPYLPGFMEPLEKTIEADLKNGRHMRPAAAGLPMVPVSAAIQKILDVKAPQRSPVNHKELSLLLSYYRSRQCMNRNGLQCMVDGIGSRVKLTPVLGVEHASMKRG